jgi:hypothetical protein
VAMFRERKNNERFCFPMKTTRDIFLVSTGKDEEKLLISSSSSRRRRRRRRKAAIVSLE